MRCCCESRLSVGLSTLMARLLKHLVAAGADQEHAVENLARRQLDGGIAVANHTVLLFGQVIRHGKARVQVLIPVDVVEDLDAAVGHQDVARAAATAAVHGEPVASVLQVRIGRLRGSRDAAGGFTRRLDGEVSGLLNQIQVLGTGVPIGRTVVERFGRQFALGEELL